MKRLFFTLLIVAGMALQSCHKCMDCTFTDSEYAYPSAPGYPKVKTYTTEYCDEALSEIDGVGRQGTWRRGDTMYTFVQTVVCRE